MKCADCNYLIWSSATHESAVDGINRLGMEQMRAGQRKHLKHRKGVDFWDLQRMPLRGQSHAERSRMAKALSAPSLNGGEIMALAWRRHSLGIKAIAVKIGMPESGGGMVSNWLKAHGLPTVSHGAIARLRVRQSARYAAARENQALGALRYVALNLGSVGMFYSWVHECEFGQKLTEGKFIGPTIPAYWRDPLASRIRAKKVFHVRKSDPIWLMQKYMRTRIYNALKLGHAIKRGRSHELLGCDSNALKMHLEPMFSDGMNWDNYGRWHIDHIRPVASFDLTTKGGQLAAFNYRNLQPLWAFDNWSKGSRYMGVKHAFPKAKTCATPPRRVGREP
jgi:hypothetical protein